VLAALLAGFLFQPKKHCFLMMNKK